MAYGVASAVTQTLSAQITDAGLAAMIAPAGFLSVLAIAGLHVAGVWLTQLSYRHGLAAPLAASTVVDPVAATTIGMLLLGETLRGGTTGVLIVVVCVAGLTVAVRQLSVAQQLVQGAADRTDKTPSPGRR